MGSSQGRVLDCILIQALGLSRSGLKLWSGLEFGLVSRSRSRPSMGSRSRPCKNLGLRSSSEFKPRSSPKFGQDQD